MTTILEHDVLCVSMCLLGPVSVGKSTTLNTLLSRQYSDMKIKRTTATIQEYCEYPLEKKHVMSEGFLDTIRAKNKEVNDRIMQKSESTELKKEDLTPMKYYIPPIDGLFASYPGTYKKIFDTPGLNDSKTDTIYYGHVTESFHKYDVVNLIFDINSALNTKDEVNILEMTINNIKKNKEVYGIHTELIILLNKCDDMTYINGELKFVNEEHTGLYIQAKTIIDNTISKLYPELTYNLCPISCEDAFIYRMYKANPKVDLDEKQLNKFGINEYGKAKWNVLSSEKKRNAIREFLAQIDHNDRMRTSGFDKYSKILKQIFTVNGQYTCIVNHIMYELMCVKKCESLDISIQLEELKHIYDRFQAVSTLFKCEISGNGLKKLYNLYDIRILDYINSFVKEYDVKYAAPCVEQKIDEKTFADNGLLFKIFTTLSDFFRGASIIVTATFKKNIGNLNEFYLKQLNNPETKVEDIYKYIDFLKKNEYKQIKSVLVNVCSNLLKFLETATWDEKRIAEELKKMETIYFEHDRQFIVVLVSIIEAYFHNMYIKVFGLQETDQNIFVPSKSFKELGKEIESRYISYLIRKIDEFNTNIITDDFEPDVKCQETIMMISTLHHAYTELNIFSRTLEDYPQLQFRAMYLTNKLQYYIHKIFDKCNSKNNYVLRKLIASNFDKTDMSLVTMLTTYDFDKATCK